MGVISDAIDALEDWCTDLFEDGIKSQFDGISKLLTDTFSQTTGSNGLVNTFITKHPSQFTGGGSGGTAVWTTIETLCNNVVVPIGGFILTIVLLNDVNHQFRRYSIYNRIKNALHQRISLIVQSFVEEFVIDVNSPRCIGMRNTLIHCDVFDKL